MRNFISCHCHQQSFDSASSPTKFAKREQELGTGYMVVTDHGTLEAARQVYDLTHSGKFPTLKPIIGIEGYFRDDNDPIFLAAGVQQTRTKTEEKEGAPVNFRERMKYAHVTMHCMDDLAYSALSRILTKADLRAEVHGSERKPLFGWSDLEELGSYNITATSSCLIGMVSRHLLDHDDYETAIKYYEKLRSCFKPGNFYVEVFPHDCSTNWVSCTEVFYADGTKERFPNWKNLKTKAGEIKAEELAKAYERSASKALKDHFQIMEVKNRRAWAQVENPKEIKEIKTHEGPELNECRPWAPDSDVQKGANRFVLHLAKKYGDPVLVSDDSHFATPDEKVVQDLRLGQNGSWRFVNSHHRLTSDEAFAMFSKNMGIEKAEFEGWVDNTYAWASKFDNFKLGKMPPLPTTFYPQDTFKHTMELVKKHGRMDWSDPARVARLKEEIQLLHKNGTTDLLVYFQTIEEIVYEYAKRGELTGPGRGSAAGTFLAYLLGITHVDPLRFNLSLDRFLTLDRIQTGKMPDIDQDLPSRDILVDPNDWTKGYLKERFGDCVAQISVDISNKLKSSIKDVFRYTERQAGREAKVPPEIEAICRALPNPPQGVSDADYIFGYKDDSTNEYIPGLLETSPLLREFVKDYPKEWEITRNVLSLHRQKGRHACAFAISSEPVYNHVPLMTVGGVQVTQYNAPSVEAAGGLKMDFLVVNSLKDIQKALKLIRERHTDFSVELDPEAEIPSVVIDNKRVHLLRCVPFNGRMYDVWDLPQDIEVYRDICQGRTETVFQLDAPAARQGLVHFNNNGEPALQSISDLSVFTALDRPGPLDAMVTASNGKQHNMLVEFSNRAKGLFPVGNLPILDELLPETKGVIVFQEQLQRIFQQVGGTTAIEANNFRADISKKKMDKVIKHGQKFLVGAEQKLGKEQASLLWEQMKTFGQYGFNASHAVCYVTISYACAFLKRHFAKEWWTAVLSNASRGDIEDKFWAFAGKYIELPDIKKSAPNFQIQGDKIRAPLSLLHGLGEKAHEHLVQFSINCNSIQELVTRIEKWKVDNATETVNKKGETVMRKGRCPVNDSIIQKLIITGIADGLFPETDASGLPYTVQERLRDFSIAKKEIAGTKLKSIAADYDTTLPSVNFQLKKDILPAYTEPLLPICAGVLPHRFKLSANGRGVFLDIQYFQDGEGHTEKTERPIAAVSGAEYEYLQNHPLFAEGEIAILGYVQEDRRFSYQKQGETKTACELKIDADGTMVKLVKWPGKNGLPDSFKEKLDGYIVACILNKRESSKGFFFNDLIIIAPALQKKDSEESKDGN